MSKPDVLSGLPIYGAISAPLAGAASASAGYAVVLNASGVIDSGFTSTLSQPNSSVVANQVARLASASRKGDILKQSDNNTSYVLSTNDPTSNANWIVVGVDSVTRDATGALTIAATGTDQGITINTTGTGQVTFNNSITATNFFGGGGYLTALQAAEIVGDNLLADAVLSTNIPRLDIELSFLDTTEASSSTTGSVKFAGGVGVAKKLYVGGGIYGVGTNITALSATNISAGVLGVANGGTGITTYTAGNFLYASGTTTVAQRTPALVRGDIGADNATNLTTGTIPVARLPAATSSVVGASMLSITASDIATSVSTTAAAPIAVKLYIDSISATTSTASKLVKTNGSGKIDSSFIIASSSTAWSTLTGVTVDTGGARGDVPSSLFSYYTTANTGIGISSITNKVSWFNAASISINLTATPSGTDKTITLPDATGTVILDVDVAATASANKIVRANGSGVIDSSFMTNFGNITYSGQLRAPTATAGAVSGTQTTKIPVYNSAGTLQGYLPLYSA